MQPATPPAPAIDPAALSRLFSLGDAALRVALCAQLRDDFTRLHAAVGSDSLSATTRAAHETKGLAATVGAYRLADIAAIVDTRAPLMGQAARSLIIVQLRNEILQVLHELELAAQAGANA
jgi:HPt (histidine-containing phosphotransfer) domain-containing protein